MRTGLLGIEEVLEESGVLVARVDGERFDMADEEDVDADAEDAVEVGVFRVLIDDADCEWT